MVALSVLFEALVDRPLPDVDITGITDDSRRVGPGDLFVAVRGAAVDGHQFASAAVAQGAAAVAAERELPDLGVPLLVLPGVACQRSELASRLYGNPSARLICVGVTGTNGKTSIACFIADLAARLGGGAGYLGTIGWGVAGALEPSELTTADAITVQRRLAGLLDQGCRWAVLEASSHALDQHRLEAVGFDYAVFSNLSRDHLDYHGDFHAYGEAKATLFERAGLEAAVVNIDDEFGCSLAERVLPGVAVLTCGADPAADVSWRALEFGQDGIRGEWLTPWGNTLFELPLYGGFSVANAAAAVAVLCHSGARLDEVVDAARTLSAVPGRMEFFRHGAHTPPDTPTLVVDYAHTPDALEKMLTALAPHVTGRLICLVGCGGDRDRGKRPLMARAAFDHADLIWLTSDNPRSEDPQAIINDMRAGLPRGVAYRECVDRGAAIDQAVAEALPEDLVVIAGKGHEDYQEVAGKRLPFSDRAIAAHISGGA